VHLPNGFNFAIGGAECALTQLLPAAAFLLNGPGLYSLASWHPGFANGELKSVAIDSMFSFQPTRPA